LELLFFPGWLRHIIVIPSFLHGFQYL
jgi:hypothetical protein